MKIYRNIQEIQFDQGTAVTVGTFDGVHRGHQAILKRLKVVAGQENLISTVVTFDPHPKKVVGPEPKTIKILTDIDERLELFEKWGIDATVVIPFTREFAQLSYHEFVQSILIERLQVRHMIIGYDHHFGRNREGTYENLLELGRQLGFEVEQVPPTLENGKPISSSRIRQLLAEGEVEKAAEFLGRHYSLKGKVVEGTGRGKALGFPTANLIPVNPDKIIPARGVYAVNVVVDGTEFKGMMNIGYRPTYNLDSLTLEVHIFNFVNSLYGKVIEVRFKKFVREERRFASEQELKHQLEKDKEICENV